jgi:hypothetical protein
MGGLQLSTIFPPPQPIGGLVHIIVRLPASGGSTSPFPGCTCLNRSFRHSYDTRRNVSLSLLTSGWTVDLVYQFLDHQVNVSSVYLFLVLVDTRL